ncbi:MAG: tetratricopeptide repeat protein [Bacteroidia bacterium]|nr:tetratricopeptide repeat protein [Bacteroidia bacterium]
MFQLRFKGLMKNAVRNKFLKWLLVFLLLNIYVPAFSQTKAERKIDSLLKVLPLVADTQKIGIMLRLASLTSKSNQEKGTEWALKALTLARKHKNETQMNSAYYKIAMYSKTSGNFEMALKYADSSLFLTKKDKDEKGIAQVYNCYGTIYVEMENYPEAIKYYIESVKIKEKLNEQEGLANTYLNLSSVYNRINLLDKSKEYLLKGLQLFEENKNYYGMAGARNTLGVLYNREQNFKKAIEVFNEALKISDSVSDKNLESALTGNLSESYFGLNNFKKAEEYGLLSYNLRKELGDLSGIAYSASELSSVYLKMKNFEKAISYANECLAYSEKSDYAEGRYIGHKNLAEANEALGNYKEAYAFLKLSIEDYETFKLVESQHAIAEVEGKYQLTKKETEIQLGKERMKSKDTEIKKQNQLKIFFGIGAVLFALAAIFILRSYFVKKKSNKIILKRNAEVEMAKAIIEEKQKEILDSIYYARRIQRTLFANEKYIERNWIRLKQGKV